MLQPLKSTHSFPTVKPKCPQFGSGPTRKYPGWSSKLFELALVGRSHRSADGLERINLLLKLTREVLSIPDDYKLALIPGSATGALETAFWGLLGARGVDLFSWDVFGKHWITDVVKQLNITDHRLFEAEYGKIPDLSQYNGDRDVVFTWNGTTAGVRIPNGNWIPEHRKGLTICDATSSAFIMPVRDWSKLDAYAFSWQKGLGGEGAHGMLVLSPRAMERLESYIPSWPVPRLFRLSQDGEIFSWIFEGKTINTPSMLCIEDAIGALKWAQTEGGQEGLWKRCLKNFTVIKNWMQDHPHLQFMAKDSSTISPASVVLELKEAQESELEIITSVTTDLTQHKVGYDIKNHNLAPPSLRIWCGPTMDDEDLSKLLPWIDWSLEKYC